MSDFDQENMTENKTEIVNEEQDRKQQKKIKRALRIARCRFLKNLIIWLVGVLSSGLVALGVIAIVLSSIPLGNLVPDSGENVREDLLDKSILEVIMSTEEITKSYASLTDAFPIIDKEVKNALSGLEQYVEVNMDAVKDVPFNSPDFSEKLMSNVKVTATLESLGVMPMLEDFASLPIFIHDLVKDASGNPVTNKTIDTTATGFKYKMYTYCDQTDGKYYSASNKDGTGWSDDILNKEVDLYYASVSTMMLSDLAELLIGRMGVMGTADLVNTFSPGAKDGLLGKILGDLAVKDINTFNEQNIKISAFIPKNKPNSTEENDTYKLLRKLLNVPEGEEVLVSHFTSGFDPNKIKISAFIDIYKPNTNEETEFYKLLRDVLKVPTGDILVSHFNTDITYNEIKLERLFPRYKENSNEETDLYKLIRTLFKVDEGVSIKVKDLFKQVSYDGINVSNFVTRFKIDGVTETADYQLVRKLSGKATGEVTVADLVSGLKTGVKLSSFIPRFESDNVTETIMFRILRSAFSIDAGKDIALGDLTGTFNVMKVKLSDILVESENKLFYDIVRSATGKTHGEVITILDVTKLNVQNCKLELFVGKYESDGVTKTKLYTILEQAVTGTGEGGAILVKDVYSFKPDNVILSSVVTNGEKLLTLLDKIITGTGPNGEILVKDLVNFDVNNMPVTEFMSTTSQLYTILAQTVPATGADGKILVKDLANFNVAELELSTVITATQLGDSKVLNALLEDGSVTVGNIDDKINNLDISKIFGAECFTDDVSKAVTFSKSYMGRYKKVVNPNEVCDTCEPGHCDCETYVLIGDSEVYTGTVYYISKESHMWLFLYYDDSFGDGDGTSVSTSDFNADGFALKYKPMHVTFGTFEYKVQKMSEEIEHATIRQLAQVGFLPPKDAYEKTTFGGVEVYTYAKNLSSAIG